MNDTMLNAVSGIKTHQFGLDSISNNIANVNTTGYKANSPEFKTLFARSMDSLNASTVTNNDFSYGVTGGSNNIITKTGNLKKADSDTAVAYTGKGWFVVGKNKEGQFEISEDNFNVSDENYFTKNGDFTIDSDGYLVNSEGYYLYGVNLGKIKDNSFKASQDPEQDYKELAKGVMKPISIPPQISYEPVETTKVDLSVNLNRMGELKNVVQAYTTNGVFNEIGFFNHDFNALANRDGDMIRPNNFSKADIEVTMPDGTVQIAHYEYGDGTSSQGRFHTIGQLQYLIKRDTGLDLELNRGANGVIDPKGVLVLKNNTNTPVKIKVSGNFFERLHITGEMDPMAKNDYIAGTNLSVPSFTNTTEVFDPSGKKYALRNEYFLINAGDAEGTQQHPETWNVRSYIHEFSGDRMLVSSEVKEGKIFFDPQGKANADDMEIPFLGQKNVKLTLNRSTNHVYAESGVNNTEQDGKNRGEMSNIRINNEGVISVAFTNGQVEAIGRVGLAMFANDQGLKKVGGNLFALNPTTANGEVVQQSGNPKLVWGEDSNLKQGKVLQGYVETSNVDVADALTSLILMQRGYSMNAKAFTTSDDLIKEAIALKRA
ncbi:flagellar hook-basal body complex protein [Helicobacter sp. MIT 14-3879]|uniref:flagellar hook-basal body complex protein n=1 Tax=Helicobacter sp. MIT 14-3879 TaxID=2040649 RepID=UPI000E1E5D03|nr:flagellar hook-basal body complex protein [Helicobacter sp. MIT 14-3879]RDU59787.1 flagellar hook-basal body protein [Helicobacter sp. MIT 14-3879]